MSKQTLVALVENKPGVLNRVASLFRRRNFNIDSLTVGRTEAEEVSRMTIVVDSSATEAWRVEENLYKLVNVIQVEDVTGKPVVSRDLALVKVRARGEQRAEVIQLCEIFRARIVDAGANTVIVEITGDEEKIEGLVNLLRPLGIEEMVRAGMVAMTRGDAVLRPNGRGGNGRPPA
jgi:acetolactate synthase-1/3 small subunit